MDKNNNESYKRIIEFLKNNPSIDKTKKKFLLRYASELILNDMENVNEISLSTVINDIKFCYDYLTSSNKNDISPKSLKEFYEIQNMYFFYLMNKDEKITLNQISEKLDYFFLNNDLGIRKNSNLSYCLSKKYEKNIEKDSNKVKYYGK